MKNDRSAKADETRLRLLSAAEKLFAERGLDAVSNRQISEAAGQANNYAVGYHFGTRTELLNALLELHVEILDPIRLRTLDTIGTEPDLRDWLRCLIEPQLKYIGTRTGPSYFGQFWMAMATTPTTAPVLYTQAALSEPLIATLNGMYSVLPALAEEVIQVRNLMTQNILITTFADFERRRNELGASDSTSWQGFSDAMVDGLVGLWSAPTTTS
ncbi:TetR/AcrR family transcriptional regulator [Gordonia liuliyuniae]|uniref:TetR/AcrR family transcriptional regulator n=1 Tax=Gordonia liuliyuniae TaxID=2911517 RepID=A0ABS9IPQ4_9ACTN|nr:TetR/AcrR family transcriptional regulator [Gordonia liuliyuniae]MCF8587540.1 TetR/AcrR family transcriptional regulator [Gordonia liuliyuniae]